MNIIPATFLSFLPKRYRDNFTAFEIPPSGAILSGIVQSLFSLYLLIHNYYAFIRERMAAIPEIALEKAGEKGGDSAIMGLGSIFMIEYFIHITTILLVFFLLEGFVRIAAAIATQEVVPTLPLKLAAVVQSHFEAKEKERALGERVRDEVQLVEGSDSIRIASCRPKPWTQLTTISHDGALFELASEQKSTAPRPYIYVLRRKPPTAVIRGIYPYDPEEVLQPTAKMEPTQTL
jgi:hypothetical protein